MSIIVVCIVVGHMCFISYFIDMGLINSNTKYKAKGFSLIELLIVLVIIGILTASISLVISNLGRQKNSAAQVNAETIAGYIDEVKTKDNPQKFFYIMEPAESTDGITITPSGITYGAVENWKTVIGPKIISMRKQATTITVSKDLNKKILGYGGYAILPTYNQGWAKLTDICLTLKDENGNVLPELCNTNPDIGYMGWTLVFFDLKDLNFSGITGYKIKYTLNGADWDYLHLGDILLSHRSILLDEDTHCIARLSNSGWAKLNLASCQFRFTPEIIGKTESDIPKNPITGKYPIVAVYFDFMGETNKYEIHDIIYEGNKKVNYIKGNYSPAPLLVKAKKIDDNTIKIINSLESAYTMYDIDSFNDGVKIGNTVYNIDTAAWNINNRKNGILNIVGPILTTEISEISSVGNDAHMPDGLVTVSDGVTKNKVIVINSTFPSNIISGTEANM